MQKGVMAKKGAKRVKRGDFSGKGVCGVCLGGRCAEREWSSSWAQHGSPVPLASLGCLAEERGRAALQTWWPWKAPVRSLGWLIGLLGSKIMQKPLRNQEHAGWMDEWWGEAMWWWYSDGSFCKLLILPFSKKYSLSLSLLYFGRIHLLI